MRVSPENVEGQLVESHEFSHSIEHRINWSHVLLAMVVLAAIFKLGPAISAAMASDDGDTYS